MKLSDRVNIPADVMAREVGDEMVILDLAAGAYFGLDPVGARIWQLMGEGKALSEICEIMLEEYEVARDDLERDTLKLADDLEAQGLIKPA